MKTKLFVIILLFLSCAVKAQDDKLTRNDSLAKFYAGAMEKCLYKKEQDTTQYKNLRTEVINLNLPFCDSIVLFYDLAFYDVEDNMQNWRQYANTVFEYVKRYAYDNHMSLDHFAWEFYRHTNDMVYLNKALGWIKHAFELSPDCEHAYMYTALLFRLDKKEEAEVMVKKTIELTRTNEADACMYMESLFRDFKIMRSGEVIKWEDAK